MNKSKKGYTFEETSHKAIGAAIEVHKNLGPGFEEVIYQRALARELFRLGLDFSREVWMPVYYKNEKIGTKRVDFFVEEILIEIKAKSEFDPQDYMQTISYLKASKYNTGLLINFGAKKVEVKRLVNNN